LKIKKTITLGLLFVLFLNFFTNITICVYNSIDDGSFDTEATVESSPSSGTLTSVSSGSFDITVVVEQTFGNMVVNSSGSWDTTVYIEYLVYSDWSPWWIMFYNSTPAISSPSPSNGSTNQPLNLTWSIDINNPDGNDFNWSIECSNGQSNSSNNDNNGTKNLSLTNLLNATTYTVWVNATSVVNNTLSSSEWYTFTTQVGTNAPVVTTGNATDITNNSATLHGNLVDDGGEPCTVWFKYGYTTNYGNTTSNQSMTSGVFSQEITSLNSGKLYHYKAFANNSFGTVNGTDKVFLTLPDNPTNVYANTTGFYNITLSWSKNSNRTVILRDNVEIYNGTGNSYKDDNLDVNTTYTYMVYSLATWTYNGTTYYQQSSGVQVSNTTFYVSPPYNQSYDLNSTTGLLNISWSRGNRSDREVVVKKTTGYPSSVGDGTIVQNSTNLSYTETVSGFAYYSIFSYNESANVYSDPLHAVWGAVSIYVYKENEPWVSIGNYTVFITNSDGSETFYQANCNNPLFLGIGDVPNGKDIILQIQKQGYETRYKTIDIYENNWYNFSFYLPPSSEGSPSDEQGEPWYVPPESEGSNESQNESYGLLYLLTVVNEYGEPLQGVKMNIKRYINTSDTYSSVFVGYTDANGQIDVYLIPETVYLVNLSKTGYQPVDEQYIPSPSIYTHTFRMYPTPEEYPNATGCNELVTLTGYINNSKVFLTYTDLFNNTINLTLYIYEYDGTNTTLLNSTFYQGINTLSYNYTVNTSNTILVYLFGNHTDCGSFSRMLTLEQHTVLINETGFNDRFSVFGNNPFGWSNLVIFVLIAAVLFSVGQRSVGIGLIAAGSLGLFIGYIIGIAVLSIGICILFIIFGILSEWRNRNREVT